MQMNLPYHAPSGAATLREGDHYSWPTNSWGPYPVPIDEDVEQTERNKRYMLTPEILRSVWPRNFQPPTKITLMNVEETAIWLEMVSTFKGWTEGKAYAESFKSNGVVGHILPYLTVKALRYELDILKLGHRLEIIAAISNSELTLLNPFVVSIRPIDFRMSASNPQTSNDNNIQWKKKWEKLKRHPAEISKWLSINCWMSSTSGSGHVSKNWSMQSQIEKLDNSDLSWLRTVEGSGGYVSKSKAARKINEVYDMKGRKVSRSRCDPKYSWIPPLELPPAVTKIEGMLGKDEGDSIGVNAIEQMMFELNLVETNSGGQTSSSEAHSCNFSDTLANVSEGSVRSNIRF